MQSALEQIQEGEINQSALDYIGEKSTDEYIEDLFDSTYKDLPLSEMTDEEYAEHIIKNPIIRFLATKNTLLKLLASNKFARFWKIAKKNQ